MTRKITKAVLPVAGLGTRFLPATKAMPKEMLTVVHKPVIQYAVEEALEAGITELIFVTGRGKASIENHFDHPYELMDVLRKKGKQKEIDELEAMVPAGVRIYYTRQGAPLGLGHAVHCAAGITDDEPFVVLLPDDIIAPQNGIHPLREMVRIYEETGKSVVLSEQVPDDKTDRYGILDADAGSMQEGRVDVKGFVEKPAAGTAPSNLAVVGRYVLTPAHMKALEGAAPGAGGEIQLTDAMAKVCAEEGYYGYVGDALRFDCGDKVGFQMANLYFAMQDDYVAPRLLPFLHQTASKFERRSEERA